ncbi:hypothetical protein AMTRI_Chr12g233690 [Amborella trichopoda]
MSLFKIPASIINSLERLMRNFLWSGDISNIKIDLIAWDNICKPRRWEALALMALKLMTWAIICSTKLMRWDLFIKWICWKIFLSQMFEIGVSHSFNLKDAGSLPPHLLLSICHYSL